MRGCTETIIILIFNQFQKLLRWISKEYESPQRDKDSLTSDLRNKQRRKDSTSPSEESGSATLRRSKYSKESKHKTSKMSQNIIHLSLIYYFLSTLKQEMNDCWEEMARQIKTFKRKLKKLKLNKNIKVVNESEEHISHHYTTHQFIQKSWKSVNPRDHKDLLKNLSLVIADGRLNPNSDEFDKICKLVREWMPMNRIWRYFQSKQLRYVKHKNI